MGRKRIIRSDRSKEDFAGDWLKRQPKTRSVYDAERQVLYVPMEELICSPRLLKITKQQKRKKSSGRNTLKDKHLGELLRT